MNISLDFIVFHSRLCYTFGCDEVSYEGGRVKDEKSGLGQLRQGAS